MLRIITAHERPMRFYWADDPRGRTEKQGTKCCSFEHVLNIRVEFTAAASRRLWPARGRCRGEVLLVAKGGPS